MKKHILSAACLLAMSAANATYCGPNTVHAGQPEPWYPNRCNEGATPTPTPTAAPTSNTLTGDSASSRLNCKGRHSASRLKHPRALRRRRQAARPRPMRPAAGHRPTRPARGLVLVHRPARAQAQALASSRSKAPSDQPPDEPKPTVEEAFVNQSTPAPEKAVRKGKKEAA